MNIVDPARGAVAPGRAAGAAVRRPLVAYEVHHPPRRRPAESVPVVWVGRRPAWRCSTPATRSSSPAGSAGGSSGPAAPRQSRTEVVADARRPRRRRRPGGCGAAVGAGAVERRASAEPSAPAAAGCAHATLVGSRGAAPAGRRT